MISICTVTLDRLQPFLEIYIDSICNKLKFVKEVIICNVEQSLCYSREQIIDGKKFRYIGGKHNLFRIGDNTSLCAQHAHGLHLCIENATKDFIWLSDPDIFFYSAVDELFLNLIDIYKLNCIGISHQNALSEAYGYFPTIAGLMVHRKDLPDKTYLAKELPLRESLASDDKDFESKLPGKYLFPGKAYVEDNLYYNPTGHFETGSNLVPWAIQKEWKWLAFQTMDCSNYSTLPYRSQPRMNIKIPKQRLLYHSGLAAGPHNKIVSFRENYQKFNAEEEI